MATARDLCTAALEYLGVTAPNETPDAADINRVFDDLNDLLDSWSTDRYMIYANTENTFSLTPGTADYTIAASGADFAMVRPGSIIGAYVTVGDIDYPLTAITAQQYNDIGTKTLESTIPQYYYYNPSFPAGTLKIYPVPPSAATVTIMALEQFVRFTNLNTAVSFPVGYARALRWNLIVETAGAFGKQPSASDTKKAAESKATLVRLNSPPLKMSFDPELSGRYGFNWSIYTDGPV